MRLGEVGVNGSFAIGRISFVILVCTRVAMGVTGDILHPRPRRLTVIPVQIHMPDGRSR